MESEDRAGEGDTRQWVRPRHLLDLEHKERRRVVASAATRSLVVAAALLGLYYAVDFDWSPVVQAGVVLAVAVAFIGAVAVWQLRSVARAELPGIRAFEALAFSSVLLVVLFSSVHLALSNDDPGAFSEPLNHTGALYFTLTTLTTVGFGDIAARTDEARVAVMAQMVANFVVLGVLIKLIVGVARKRIADAGE